MTAVATPYCPDCHVRLVEQRMPTSLGWNERDRNWYPVDETTYFVHPFGRPCPSSSDDCRTVEP